MILTLTGKVNYKKVNLHILNEATILEKELRQLASFFHARDRKIHPDGYHIHTERYTAICDAMMQCKGAVAAMTDARVLTKAICCVHRCDVNDLLRCRRSAVR